MLKKSDFYYDLPERLIAQSPVEPRDSARLFHYNESDNGITHRIFNELPSLLKKGDLLVVNNTRVIPARLMAYDEKGRIYEVLLLKRINTTDWEALLKPARKARIGTCLTVNGSLKLTIQGITDNGVRLIRFEYEGIFEVLLNEAGSMPLPHYITKKLENKERYQTVYAKTEGSSASPTAGLHFTNELIATLKEKGIEFVEILLHVGLGTFRPVKCDNISSHNMHEEFYEVSKESADLINKAIAENRRIIAVGTTSVRTLESVADDSGFVEAKSGETNIFIYPPYKFKVVKGLITNFHLPESTLIMLVSAFIGREKTLEIYNTAVKENYRFFSFGDSMFLEG
ncbi:MAG: tRNA preQ1(34) S-adenosylmethionine ribosyltransferase-isomerase QueA, partial [Firmicutes bacterium]|nr:tRNA preQ1(34) S-adenosylmethionine ribosyltransferase-isomerase QueA [Bacillota bacterium]